MIRGRKPRVPVAISGAESPQVLDLTAKLDKESYQSRINTEIANFENDKSVHDLPDIFHYWSNKYLLPMIRPFGFINPDDFFVRQLEKAILRAPAVQAKFISIGSGNCDTEVRVARSLIESGYSNFSIECLDLNETMLARGLALAHEQGLADHIIPICGDFNKWMPCSNYHAVMANQSLHHVLDLEHLFEAISVAITSFNGVLITSDMIGRNGHQRWDEALSVVREYWKILPKQYKFNHQLKRTDLDFVNWDCSTDGFEGIRAQDIMPLLNERFHFDLFVPFANVITPFIDRGFGHNFDINSEHDKKFIDLIHARDEDEIRSGRIKPTQMFAVLSNDFQRPSEFMPPLSPAFCIRNPEPTSAVATGSDTKARH
jgi:hypothetical protein